MIKMKPIWVLFALLSSACEPAVLNTGDTEEKIQSARTMPGVTFARATNPSPFMIPPQDTSGCEVGKPGNYQFTDSKFGDLDNDGRPEVVMTYYGSADFGSAIDLRAYGIDLTTTPPTLQTFPLNLPLDNKQVDGVSWIGDLDHDGLNDLIGNTRPYYGTGGGQFARGEPWPNGHRVDHRVSVNLSFLDKDALTISTRLREPCADGGHQVRVFKQIGPREFQQANELLPVTEDGVDVQAIETARFPRYDALGFVGFNCPSGEPVRNLFLRNPGGTWALDTVAYQGCGSAMGVLFEPEALYITCFPQVYRYGLNTQGNWEKTFNPFEVDRDANGFDLIPWGIKTIQVKDHSIYLVAHGQDDGCRPEYVKSILSTTTAYTQMNGDWTKLDLGDLTRDEANWRWLETSTIDGRVLVTVGTIGNDPKGRSIGQGTPQVYVATP